MREIGVTRRGLDGGLGPEPTGREAGPARSAGARGLLKMMLKERIMEMSRYTSSGFPYYRRLSPLALKLQVALVSLLFRPPPPRVLSRERAPRGGIHYVDFRNRRLKPPAPRSCVRKMRVYVMRSRGQTNRI